MASKSNGAHSLETDWARAPPRVDSFWKRCGNVFYNPEENSCFGRTPKRWGILITFYAIFYAVLAALFAVCMAALFATLDDKKPTFILASSLIGDNPGVSFRPMPRDGFLVSYHTSNVTQSQPYIKDLQTFLDSYKEERWLAQKSTQGCSEEDQFGFPDSPCFFIKVNKIYGWAPEMYEASDLPADMPEDLQEYIKALPEEEQKQVWVSCFEEHKETSNDTLFEYPWGRGLPGSFFPYTNTEGYRNPLVAVKITPKVGNLVVIRCRAWAKNIIYNKSIKEASGYARILLYAEADNSTDITDDDVTRR